MKTIKIKVKHIVYFVLATLILFFGALPLGILQAAKYFEEKNPETAKVLYKRYLSISPYKNQDILYKLAHTIAPLDKDKYMAVFLPSMRSGGYFVTKEMVNNAINYYKKIVDNYSSGIYYEDAYNNLLYLYTSNIMLDKANDLIEKGLESSNPEVYKIALQYKMFYLTSEHKYEAAKAMGEKFLDKKYDYDIYNTLGNISIISKDFKAAEAYFKKAAIYRPTNYWNLKSIKPYFNMFNTETEETKAAYVNKFSTEYNGSGSIRGRVIRDGKPMPFTAVFLKDKRFTSLNCIGNESQGMFTFTDYNGDYSFENLPPGAYAVGIMIPSTTVADYVLQGLGGEHIWIDEKINQSVTCNFNFVKPFKILSPMGKIKPKKGKVDIIWEPVPGADYYNIRITTADNPYKFEGGYVSFGINKNKIKDPKFTIDIEKSNYTNYGSSVNDKGMISPYAYVGVFSAGSKVPFHVEAFDKKGRLISSSVPTLINYKDMSYISMEDYKIDDGEKLISEGKIEEALKYYQEKIKSNPNDIKSIRILSKIYLHGLREDIKYPSRIPEGRDFGKYLDLTYRLYEITGDKDYIRSTLNSWLYNDTERIKYTDRLIEFYKMIPDAEKGVDEYNSAAELYLRIGRFRESKNCFDKVLALKPTDYYNLDAVTLNLYLEDFNVAKKFLDILNLDLYVVDTKILKNYITIIENKNKTSEEYKEFKNCLKLLLYRPEDFRKEFKTSYNKIKDHELKNVLNQLGEYYQVFDGF